MQGRGDAGGVVLGVPAVAQQDERQPGGPQAGLGLPVLTGQPQGRAIGVQHAGVGQQLDPGPAGGGDHRLVLGEPPAHLVGGDQQEPVHPLEGGLQAVRAVVVAQADLHPEGGQVGQGLGPADDGDQLAGGHLGQQGLEDEPAELAGGTGDGDHGNLL